MDYKLYNYQENYNKKHFIDMIFQLDTEQQSCD